MLPWLLLIGPGCLEFFLDPIDPSESPPQEVVIRESFVQQPLPKVDLLLVIDDTGSMAQEQNALSKHFDALLSDLDVLGIGWQLGVVSTAMDRTDAGWLRGTPWILTPDVPDRELSFADMVRVGTDGSGPEAGLAAAAAALALASDGPNVGFRRPDALLNVIFVSDTDDQSDAWLGPDPDLAFLEILAGEAEATGNPARASGLVGPLPEGCTSLTGSAQPAVRYARVIEGSGGISESICAGEFGEVLGALSEANIAWRDSFELRSVPVSGSVIVRVDDVPTPDGWTLGLDPPRIDFAAPPPPNAQIDVEYLVSLETG